MRDATDGLNIWGSAAVRRLTRVEVLRAALHRLAEHDPTGLRVRPPVPVVYEQDDEEASKALSPYSGREMSHRF